MFSDRRNCSSGPVKSSRAVSRRNPAWYMSLRCRESSVTVAGVNSARPVNVSTSSAG
jgi:hypothetical protein